ncbi:MAG TPA: ribonuclease HII [Solimonas sp.]|nr:ribonuclease HII [Solimonas sp.]
MDPSRPTLIAGIDEAGRGCLAGPVYAGAVILGKVRIRGLDDSKKLLPERREELFEKIQRRALAWAVGIATVEEVDRINILRASLLAMARAVAALHTAPEEAWVDGNQPPTLPCRIRMVIGGDGLHPCIMAASIVAKVARDREMRRLDSEFPGYGFAQHKGYATPEHRQALRVLGPSTMHRMSFAPCAQADLFGGDDAEFFDPGFVAV